MNVETILQAKGRAVVTIEPDASIADAVDLMRRKRIGAVVVSDDGERVGGILSERDIIHALADEGARTLELKVAALMTRHVYSCRPDDTVADIMAEMTTRRIRHLPVVENGRLSGIVSIGDVVKNRLDEVESEASSLRQFITSA
ncbi:MAG TPA: CBS domain-containing protein [Stellaceae bacterium]|nr:CBS domain-containing protein [Stellaceae bacterium]